jgi:hypothetical protein
MQNYGFNLYTNYQSNHSSHETVRLKEELSKRIEYKEATLRFGRRRLLIFEVFRAFTERVRGRRVILDSVYGSHLTCRNLDSIEEGRASNKSPH